MSFDRFVLRLLVSALSGISLAAHAQAPVVEPSVYPLLANAGHIEHITVTPAPEDRAPPKKDRWQRFEEALNAGPARRYRRTETATNQGERISCYEPCSNNCCATSGGFSTTGQSFGQ